MQFILCKICKKDRQICVDVKTNTVHCIECDAQIEANQFLINSLKITKSFREKKTNKKPFSYKCNNCGITSVPDITKDKAFCPKCKSEMQFNPIFFNMLKDHLYGKQRKE